MTSEQPDWIHQLLKGNPQAWQNIDTANILEEQEKLKDLINRFYIKAGGIPKSLEKAFEALNSFEER